MRCRAQRRSHRVPAERLTADAVAAAGRHRRLVPLTGGNHARAHGCRALLRRCGPDRSREQPMTQQPAVATKRRSAFANFRHELRESFGAYLKHDLKRVIAFAILGFALGWLVNVALLGFLYNGQQKVPLGAPATGTSEALGTDGMTGPAAPTLILGSLFWLIASTVLFALISFRLEVGREEFWTDVRQYPRIIGLAFTTLGVGSVGAVAWGFGGALLVELLLQPAMTALIAVGIALAAGARVLRPVVSELFMVVWRSVE